jgi:hypothetical protein
MVCEPRAFLEEEDMTTRGFTSVCLKLVAVYYLVQTIAGFATASFFQAYTQSSGLGWVYPGMTVMLPGVMSLGLLWLIRKSDLLASKLIREDSPLASPQIPFGDLQSVAFSCIGLSFIISALGEITPIIAYHYLISRFKFAGAILGNMDALYSNMAGILLRLGGGVFLFLYPRGLIALWMWFQDRRGLRSA